MYVCIYIYARGGGGGGVLNDDDSIIWLCTLLSRERECTTPLVVRKIIFFLEGKETNMLSNYESGENLTFEVLLDTICSI